MRKLSAFATTLFCLASTYFGFGGCSSTPAVPPVLHALSLQVTGVGLGTVSSNVGGINCQKAEGTCSAEIEEGTEVTLTATPEPGYVFLGWHDGDCSGGNTCTLILNEAKDAKAAFIPILFVSNRKLDSSEELASGPVRNAFTIKTDGTGVKAVTNMTIGDQFDGIVAPKWSPDGEKTLFQSRGVGTLNDGPTSNVWIAAGDGSALSSLTKSTFGGQNVSPQWSPDGSRIVFCSDRKLDGTDAYNTNQTLNIWLMNADGSDPHPLTTMTHADAYNCQPKWSPDGSKIFFNASRDLDGSDQASQPQTYNIWSILPDGTELKAVTQITAANIDNALTDFSDDGSKILFTSKRHLDGSDAAGPNGATNIWIVDSDGNNLAPLTHFTAASIAARGAIFSQNSSDIFFVSNTLLDGSDAALANDTDNIWTAKSDGTNATPLTSLTEANIFIYGMNFSADGSQILYNSTRDVSGNNVPGSVTNANLWSIGANGSNDHPITQSTAPQLFNTDGRWSK